MKTKRLNRDFLDAIVACNKEEARRLLKAGADVNARDDEHDQPAILLAAEFCDKELVEWLIDKGAKIDERDDQGRTALFYASVGSEVFASLLAAGANIHAVDRDGDTILMRTIWRSPSLAEVEELLSLGIDPNVLNKDGESALDIATSLGLINIVERLTAAVER